MTRNTLVSLAVAGCLLAAAVALGHWREPLVAAAALPMLTMLLFRRRPAPSSGPDAPFIRGCLLYAVLAAGLAGWDLLIQTRLPELLSPLAANALEGREALKGWLLARGADIYPGASPPWPRLITLYPPLFYLAAAALTPFAGSTLLAGKLAALAGAAAILTALFVLGRRLDGKPSGPLGGLVIGLLAALTAFAQPEMGNTVVCRPDTLAVGCLLAAAAMFEAARIRGDWRLFAASGLLMALACLGKQQMWPLAGAYAALLFVFRLSRRERLSALAGLAGGGAVLGLLCLAWFGPGIWVQTVLFPKAMTGLAADNSHGVAYARLRDFAAGHGPLLAAYAGWLALCAVRRRLPLPDSLLLAFVPFLWRTLMWSGADTNHLLLPATVAALGAARLAGYLAGRGPVARGLAALALAGCLPAGITLHAPSAATFAPRPSAAAEAEAARTIVSNIQGPLLADAEGAFLFAGTPAYGKLWVYDAFETDMYDRLGLAAMADSPMAAAVRGRLAARFVDSRAFVSRKLLSLVGLYYEPAEKAGPYTFYRPRPETGLIAMPAADRVERGDGGYTAAVTEARGVRQWGSYIQAEDPALGMTLAYAVAGPAAAGGSVSYCPRLTGPDQTITVTALAPDGRELGRAVHRQGDFPERGEGFDNRTRLTFPVSDEGFAVRFTATGGAQLWLNADNPLVIGATAAAGASE
ncbi:MAG: hypothetical protein B193_3521 [Solidesulfovibrio magneticus str. Maddingley MBC34]|uniref:Glycosyltransferase RgtA/B/C/D-like domain-containing protein n=1 Tax=Solidesulfovibrio magneticus str. Maddingley MBC34 TaxID=1206767 RepID=K6GLG4_9BACT|nr:MAG: hypothetical protein B193_3521 [Solidesulfovibrio magneticus str. Maddingley MBC34]